MTDAPWADRQLSATRQFVGAELNAVEFSRELLSARHRSIGARESLAGDLEEFLDDVWYAIDMHNEYDDLREPDEFDDAQLLDVLTGYLADWDAGSWQPDPRWAR